MKKVIVMCCLSMLIFSGLAVAESWHTANAVTVSWDAVPKIVETDEIKYQMYINHKDGEPMVYGGEISANESVIKFEKEGKFYIGVQTVRYPLNETVGIKSESISWSSDVTVCGADGAFGIVYYLSPANVTGIRIIK